MTARERLMLRAIKEHLAATDNGSPRFVVPVPEVRNLVKPEAPQVQVDNHVDVPGVQIDNHVEPAEVHVENLVQPTPITVHVHVDMTPVAEAMDRLADALAGQSELMSQLIQVLAEQPAPTFAPVIRAGKTRLDSGPLAEALERLATLAAAGKRGREKRKLTITHDDGTESTVTEE